MANASNSNMNIPNTFNLTGTWQNNIEPLNSRTNTAQLQAQQNPSSLNTNDALQAATNSPLNANNIVPSRQSSSSNQNRANDPISLGSQNLAQNFTPARVVSNGSNQVNDLASPECINCQSENTQTLVSLAQSQIGKNTTIEFLLGENTLIEKTGTIVSVGENYILLNEAGTRNLVACDLKNIKFIYFEY